MASPRPKFAQERLLTVSETARIIADAGWILQDDSDDAVAEMLIGAGVPAASIPADRLDEVKAEAKRLSAAAPVICEHERCNHFVQPAPEGCPCRGEAA